MDNSFVITNLVGKRVAERTLNQWDVRPWDRQERLFGTVLAFRWPGELLIEVECGEGERLRPMIQTYTGGCILVHEE